MRFTDMDALVVEDDPFVADVLKLILEDYGFRVMCTASGTVGVERVRSRRFSVVLTDLWLPDISGIEVLTAAREYNPAAVVIMTTASGSTETRDEALRCGAAGFLLKPFSPAQLLEMLESAIQRRACETGDDAVSP